MRDKFWDFPAYLKVETLTGNVFYLGFGRIGKAKEECGAPIVDHTQVNDFSDTVIKRNGSRAVNDRAQGSPGLSSKFLDSVRASNGGFQSHNIGAKVLSIGASVLISACAP